MTADTLISADSSSFGLGAALMQKIEGDWRPVAYASRSLSSTERKYAQIEKEALAICWACDKFSYYILGKDILIETDHKPLVAILGTKELAKLPIRVQRFRLRMMTYSYKVFYTPGSKLVLADALSRSTSLEVNAMTETGESWADESLAELPIASGRLARIKAALIADDAGRFLLKFTNEGWPNSKQIPDVVKNVYTFRDYLTQVDGIIFFMNRVFIPELERDNILKDIHKGHQGESNCIRRASDIVWWPGMTREIRKMVARCDLCEKFRQKAREPLISTPFPERPWWRLAIDLFEMQQKSYLITIDYYSRFIAVDELDDSTEAHVVCGKVKYMFCTLGVPNTVVTDNGPQFMSEKFRELLRKWDVQHITSSPKNPRSNGEVERAVRTVKGLMNKNLDWKAALCMYRDTPLANGYSPSQLLNIKSMNFMGILSDHKIDVNRLKKVERNQRQKQARWYNSRHAARDRSPLALQQPVIIRDPGTAPKQAMVIGTKGREVVALGASGNLLRRNRALVSRSLRKIPGNTLPSSNDSQSTVSHEHTGDVFSKDLPDNPHLGQEPCFPGTFGDGLPGGVQTPGPLSRTPVKQKLHRPIEQPISETRPSKSPENLSLESPVKRSRYGRQLKRPTKLNL